MLNGRYVKTYYKNLVYYTNTIKNYNDFKLKFIRIFMFKFYF